MTAGRDAADASEPAVALAGVQFGKPMREIAVDLYGVDRVAAGWHADSRMRAKVRRLVSPARVASRARSGGAAAGTS